MTSPSPDMIWTEEAENLLRQGIPDRQLAFDLNTSPYLVRKRRIELDLNRYQKTTAEIYVEDVENLYYFLKEGWEVDAVITIYGASEMKKEVTVKIKKLYPHHALCEYEGKIYSIQLVDIALKNRRLL